MANTKTCTACSLTKPITDFYKRTDRPTRQSRCKSCVATYMRQHRSTEPARERARTFYAGRRDSVIQATREWYKNHPAERAEMKRRRRAREMGTRVSKITTEQLASKREYWRDRCWMCGAEAQSWDHVKPLAVGGPHILANLRPACLPCNQAKGARWRGPRHL